MRNINKGDKIIFRSAAIIDENNYNKIGGHIKSDKPLTVIKVFKSGVRTKEYGFVHKNNIISVIQSLKTITP